MPVFELTDGWAVLIDCLAWAVWSAGVGYAMHRVPLVHWERDTWLTRLRRFEDDGRFWERRLAIRRWKRHLPEAGALFDGGFDKKRLGGTTQLERFVAETRRAEVTHWVVMAAGPAFVLWNPPWLAVVMIAFGLLANLPCLVTQRYNRARLIRVVGRARRLEPMVAPRTATDPRC